MVTNQKLNVATTTLMFRKWFLDEDIYPEDIKPGTRPSSVLLDHKNPGTVKNIYTDIFEVPESEFLEVLSALPDFKTLPTFGDLWREANSPTIFLLKCHDIGDELFIDTQGYDYPRYKAYVYETEEGVVSE